MKYCMENLKDIGERRNKRQQVSEFDAVQLHCLALAAKLKLLGQEKQLDCLHDIDEIVYKYMKQAVQENP